MKHAKICIKIFSFHPYGYIIKTVSAFFFYTRTFIRKMWKAIQETCTSTLLVNCLLHIVHSSEISIRIWSGYSPKVMKSWYPTWRSKKSSRSQSSEQYTAGFEMWRSTHHSHGSNILKMGSVFWQRSFEHDRRKSSLRRLCISWCSRQSAWKQPLPQ